MYKNRFAENDEYKQQINEFRPLSQNTLSQIKAYFKISFTYASNAIEGNSLTLNETKIALEDGITVGGKPVKDYLEVIGNGQAYDLLFDIAKDNRDINSDTICYLHKILYTPIDSTNAGKYRQCNVLITGSEFNLPKHNEIPALMNNFDTKIQENISHMHPIEFAAWLHERLVSIHPFIDGNGRTARLIMNLALLKSGYNIVTIPPVVRNDYISALQHAQLHNNLQPFINFISEIVLESQKEYLRIIERLSD
mgnify:CR=1 FL=1